MCRSRVVFVFVVAAAVVANPPPPAAAASADADFDVVAVVVPFSRHDTILSISPREFHTPTGRTDHMKTYIPSSRDQSMFIVRRLSSRRPNPHTLRHLPLLRPRTSGPPLAPSPLPAPPPPPPPPPPRHPPPPRPPPAGASAYPTQSATPVAIMCWLSCLMRFISML